eukprot:5963321-Amphidinium_carterae.1
MDPSVYPLHQQWNKFPGPRSLRSKSSTPHIITIHMMETGRRTSTIDVLHTFEPGEDPQLPLPPPHEDLDEIEDKVKQSKIVRFAEELEESMTTDRMGTPNSNCERRRMLLQNLTDTCIEPGDNALTSTTSSTWTQSHFPPREPLL